ncbi:MAG: beta-mannosidase, partial [Streptosporangiaceae bacterium]
TMNVGIVAIPKSACRSRKSAYRATICSSTLSGDGAWGIEVTGVDNGYSVRRLAGLADFVGPHVYPMGDDVVRQHLTAAFTSELAAVGGRPVVLEEFGLSTDFASAANAGHYYRQVLHTSLLGGATGWLAWNNTDYDDLFAQDPYRHHPFEMHFGVTDAGGRPKAPLREMRAFASMVDAVDLARCEREPAEAAIVVPAYLETGYPFTRPEDRTYVFDVLRQAYVAGREADLRARLLREVDGLAGGAKLYISPSTKQLTGPSWHRLAELAAEGAVVYVSYGAGGHGFQRGPWYADLDGLFGVEHQLMYGLAERIVDDEVRWSFAADFGPIGVGTTLTFRAGGNEHSRSYLPVEPTDAEVVAVDQHGRPALLRRAVGRGQVVLSTYPLEHMAAASPRVNPEDTWRVYDALADAAGVGRPVTVADPRVLVDGLVHVDGRRFVWLVSESSEEVAVKPTVSDGPLREPGSGAVADEVTLPPYGVRVLEVSA